MKAGPANVTLGLMSCHLCGADIPVANNKHGYPAAFCKDCRAQEQVRGDRGSLLLLGKVHTWQSPDAAAAMLAADDAALMYPRTIIKPGVPPPHLAAKRKPANDNPAPKPAANSNKEPAATVPKKQSFWDKAL